MTTPKAGNPRAPTTLRDLRLSVKFRPAIIDALRGYNGTILSQDLAAGLVVGIVALPLAIAFSIASGADPRAGLITAALAGMVVAAFGGSRVQIAGPTGAFVVILYGIVQGYGFEKLLVATVMAGALLFLFGLFRLGTLIKFIPYPVTTGFTAGIAVIIFLGQIPHILGLRLNDVGIVAPAEAIGKVDVIARHLDRVQPAALILAIATVLILYAFKRWVPRIPGPAVALAVLSPLAALVPFLGGQTVGDLFMIQPGPPAFSTPAFSLATVKEMLPPAFTIALLGAIESLLSAVVADGMAGTKHDSNQELMGQGIANIIVPLFGGIAATGAIARTATNVQLGAKTPVASFVHGIVVLLVLLVAAPLVSYVPMAVLGGILAVVSWNMSERRRFAQLLRMPIADAGVMVTTFSLTVLVSLTVAVEVGIILAAALFLARMSTLAQVNLMTPESDPRYAQQSLEGKQIPPDVTVYGIDGPFFFGAAEKFQEIVDDRLGHGAKVLILRMRQVPYMDATALNALTTAIKQFQKHKAVVILSAVQGQPFDMMMRSGLTKIVGDENIKPNIDLALQRAREILGIQQPLAPAAA